MKRTIASLVACSLLVSACATTRLPQQAPQNVKQWLEQQSRARKGAIVGALIGAAIGATVAQQTGHNVAEGALAGGVAGGLTGFLIGRSRDRVFAARDEAIRVAHYDRTQGYLARVDKVGFEPAQPKPGQTASLHVRYLVIGPKPGESIRVRLFRGIKYGARYVAGAGPNEFTVPRGGGIVDSTMPVTLPAGAPQGTYGLEALLEDPSGRFPQAIRSESLFILARLGDGSARAASIAEPAR